MRSLYVTGGQQRTGRPLTASATDWYEYQQGLILEVIPETGEVHRRVAYVSPPEACAEENPQILFKSGALLDDRMYVCTQTEVLIYTLPEFRQAGYLSLPCFNDLHHVRPTSAGTLLVANSGLDMVLELTPGGGVLNEWSVLGEAPWSRFSRAIDYRKGVSTKPHAAHPNYVFTLGEEVWATRFQQQDAICLTSGDRRIPIGIERVHDGVLHEGRLFFTTVNGHVVIANPASLKVEEIVDLNGMHAADTLLGWCRGILLDGTKAWIGFSHIRPTKFRENLAWVVRGFRQVLPTRLACYDLARRCCVAEIDLQAHGLDAVFGILPGYEENPLP
ncbi:MAG TPA: hypothetical protein VKE41_08355 [Roseiflexaceae bacterium]|nr:hypothetical protein [Roseiflexaceae bacterium]